MIRITAGYPAVPKGCEVRADYDYPIQDGSVFNDFLLAIDEANKLGPSQLKRWVEMCSIAAAFAMVVISVAALCLGQGIR